MWLYIAKRVLYTIPISFGVSLVCFCLVYLAPGDPASSLIPPDASAADIKLIRQLYGFDQPVPVQFAKWLWRALHGDFGTSLQTGRPVLVEVSGALVNTASLAAGAIVIAFALALVGSMLAAWHRDRPVDRIVTSLSTLGISIPSYWLGIVLIIAFAVKLRWLPATGMGSDDAAFDWLDWNDARFAVLPMLTMALLPLGVVMRSARAALADTLSQDFVLVLRAKGLAPPAMMRHALRNALPQVLAVMGLQLGYLIGGSILIETIFTWPGTGFLLSKAILTRDVPLLQGTVLILALTFVFINLAVDVLQTLVDPRIQRQ